jgi:hypothetical protein
MKQLLLTMLVVFTTVTFSSCTKEPAIETPSIVGNWKVEKVKIVAFTSNLQYWDTTVNNVTEWLGASYFYDFKADKSFEDKTVDKNTGSVTTNTGTYNLSGTNLTLNYKDLTVDEYQSVSFDGKRLVMTSYDPSKTDPERSIMTWELSRQ